MEQELEGCEESVVTRAISSYQKRRGVIRYNKEKYANLPEEPKSLADVDISGEWTQTQKGEDFILANHGTGESLSCALSLLEH